MSGTPVPVAGVRLAVRAVLRTLPSGSLVLAACSGGADSLALAAAAGFEAPAAGLRAGAVVVDHGLQPGSAQVAAVAQRQCSQLGLDPVRVVPVVVADRGSGPEGDARGARYAALRRVADELGAGCVLLGHTRDDQAEQVLLGLARGSGTRSLSGMPSRRDIFARPLLGLPRSTTAAACAAQGLSPWEDPHNQDPAYRRVRVRRLLADLERDLGPGIAAALARSADLLRADADALDGQAAEAYARLGPTPWRASDLAALPAAVRGRLWRLGARDAGCAQLTAAHVRALDALVDDWHGQGPVDLPGGRRASRHGQQVVMRAVPPHERRVQ